MTPRALAAVNGLVLLAALGGAGLAGALPGGPSAPPAVVAAQALPSAVPTAAAPAAPAVSPPGSTPVPTASPAPAAPRATPPQPTPSVPRTATTTGYAPYAQAGPVVLHAPGDVVEAIGFHQAGHDGAQPQRPLPGPVRAGSLEDRGRGTHPDGAADIVVDPAREVRAPVTGTVVRAGTYALYCDEVDQYLVVAPDAQPSWEVKVLHVQGLSVATGDRLQAGVTVVAAGARRLPFASQVDAFTATPTWPHVHVEVVDPSVPDRPGSGDGC